VVPAKITIFFILLSIPQPIYVENIGREGTRAVTCTLRELRDREVNMFTTVFIGNSETEILGDKALPFYGFQ